MTHRFNRRLSKAISTSARKLRAAESAHRRLTRKVQAECKHEVVYAAPFTPSKWFSAQYPRRLCACCGYEEENAYGISSWTGYATDAHYNTKPKSKLKLTTNLVINITQSELNSKRPY